MKALCVMARSVLSGLPDVLEGYAAFIFTHPKKGGSNFLRNTAKCILDYAVTTRKTIVWLFTAVCGPSLRH